MQSGGHSIRCACARGWYMTTKLRGPPGFRVDFFYLLTDFCEIWCTYVKSTIKKHFVFWTFFKFQLSFVFIVVLFFLFFYVFLFFSLHIFKSIELNNK